LRRQRANITKSLADRFWADHAPLGECSPNSRCTTSLRIADDPADTKEHLRRTRAFAAVHFGKKTSALMPREDGTLEVRLPSGVECGVVFG